MMTSAPRARSSRAFSCDILSGMVKMQWYPFTAAAIANPTPVLPDVASTIKPPGFSFPARSAASIIARPMRSLTEPPGLKNSAFPNTGVRIPRVTLLIRISGVQPIVSRTLAYGLMCCGTRVRARLGCVRRWARRIDGRGANPGCVGRGCVWPDDRRTGSRSRSGRRRSSRRRRRRRWRRQRHRPRARRAHLAEFDRLEERCGHRDAVPLRGRKPQGRRAGQRRRIERGVATPLRDARGLREELARRVHEEAQRHVPFDFLLEKRGWIRDRYVGIERNRRLRLGRRRRLARLPAGLL